MSTSVLCAGRVVCVLVGRPRDVGRNRTEVALERIVRRRKAIADRLAEMHEKRKVISLKKIGCPRLEAFLAPPLPRTHGRVVPVRTRFQEV